MQAATFDYTWRDYFGVASVLNQVSAILAGLILFILFVLAVYDGKMVNRISLRLTAAIALVDVLNHLNNVYHRTLGEGNLCVASAFWRIFGRQVYCFLNISIALNLHLILLGGLRPKASWEKFYWLLSVLVPLTMNLPPLLLGMYGFNGEFCSMRNIGYDKVLLVINLSSVILITLVYCTLVSVLVMIRLRAKLVIIRNLDPNQSINQHIQRQVETSLKKLIFRISLYPSSAVLSLFFYFFAIVWRVFDEADVRLDIVAMLSLTLTGSLNFIAFLFDPTLHNATRALTASLKSRFYRSTATDSSVTFFLRPKTELSHRTSIHGDNNLRLL